MKRSSSSSWPSVAADGIYTRTRSRSAPLKRRKGDYPLINKDDLFSQLPDEILEIILSKLPTAEAARTSVLASRWVDQWRRRPDLVLDMRTVFKTELAQRNIASESLTESLEKVMKKHRGDLESCKIYHHCREIVCTIEGWINYAIHEKKTKSLTVETHCANRGPDIRYNIKSILRVNPSTFSSKNLTYLSLSRFIVIHVADFKGCTNLKTLILNNVLAYLGKMNKILARCSSLEVLLLQNVRLKVTDENITVLRIENDNLKYLQVTTQEQLAGVQVYAKNLEVLDIGSVCCDKDNFVLVAPNLNKFKRDFVSQGLCPHISCNISYLVQEKKSVWQELMLSGLEEVKRYGSLSVNVDINNPKEVAVLKELFLLWSVMEMDELEIVIKYICGPEGFRMREFVRNRFKKSEIGIMLPMTNFRAKTVRLYNYSIANRDADELARQFSDARHKNVIGKFVIIG